MGECEVSAIDMLYALADALGYTVKRTETPQETEYEKERKQKQKQIEDWSTNYTVKQLVDSIKIINQQLKDIRGEQTETDKAVISQAVQVAKQYEPLLKDVFAEDYDFLKLIRYAEDTERPYRVIVFNHEVNMSIIELENQKSALYSALRLRMVNEAKLKSIGTGDFKVNLYV